MVRESDCGLLLSDASARAVAEAIDALGDPSVRQRLGQSGRQAAQDRFNATTMQERLAAIYERLRSAN
jgi:glycosyltransferase involved in cell wall biosynthesis